MSIVQHRKRGHDPLCFALSVFLQSLEKPLVQTKTGIFASSDGDAQTLLLFVNNLDNDSQIRLLMGCLKIPFNIDLRQKVEKFIAVSVRKIYRICRTGIARPGVTRGSK